jgi:1,4-dihydroxy-2-naphthoate octaprenyltransferase
MAIKHWITGARVRTLPLAFAPIVLGSATADLLDRFNPVLALLALMVALFLQIAVNYANDYSDGIRGTDKDRVGPLRLTASGLVRPQAVKRAAFISFGLAALSGLGILLLTSAWWLALVGLISMLAAWYYTGGKRPYGYAGLGEIAVFVFFGLVATTITNYIQTMQFDALAFWLGANFGLYAAAVLLINNIRDIATDSVSGKRTIAVKLGAKRAKVLFTAMLLLPVITNLMLILLYPATILGLINLLVLVPAYLSGVRGKTPKEQITSLKLTSLAGLGYGLLVGLGLFLVSFGI